MQYVPVCRIHPPTGRLGLRTALSQHPQLQLLEDLRDSLTNGIAGPLKPTLQGSRVALWNEVQLQHVIRHRHLEVSQS